MVSSALSSSMTAWRKSISMPPKIAVRLPPLKSRLVTRRWQPPKSANSLSVLRGSPRFEPMRRLSRVVHMTINPAPMIARGHSELQRKWAIPRASSSKRAPRTMSTAPFTRPCGEASDARPATTMSIGQKRKRWPMETRPMLSSRKISPTTTMTVPPISPPSTLRPVRAQLIRGLPKYRRHRESSRIPAAGLRKGFCAKGWLPEK